MKRISASLIILYSLLNAGNTEAFKNKIINLGNIRNNVEIASNFESKTNERKDYKKNDNIHYNSERVIELDDIERLISSNSKELKIIADQIKEAKLLLKSELSKWYPKLNLSSAGFPQYMKGNTYNEFSSDTSNNQAKATLTATLKWDLINPSRIPEIENARLNLKSKRVSYSIKYRDLVLEAYTNFFNLQKTLQDIRIAEESIRSSSTSLKEAKIRYNSGIGTKFDVLEAETQLSKDNQFLVSKLGLRKINERKLSQILNLPNNIIPKINSMPKIIGIWKDSLDSTVEYAYNYRKEIDELLIQINTTNNNANIALSMNKPKVSIFNRFDSYLSEGEIGMVSPRKDNTVSNYNNTLGLQFEWPIFDGGYGKAKYYAAKAKMNSLETELDLKKDNIRQEVEEIYYNMDISRKNIKNSYLAVKSARESLRLAVLRLKEGITTQREVVNNQKDLTQAEVNYINIITEYNTNLIQLKRNTGIKQISTCLNNSNTNKKFDSQDLKNKNSTQSLSLENEPCMELFSNL